MLELPRYHVPREALRRVLVDAPVVVIEAASGFGKSTLAAELTAGDDRVFTVALTGQETGRHALLLPLGRALRRMGEHDAASALGDLAATPADALDAMMDAIQDSHPLTIVVDDAHHLDTEAGLLCHLVALRPRSLRLVITARTLPASATKLRSMPGVERVDDTALRFDDTHTRHLLRVGFGLEVDDDQVTELTSASGGWPAAIAFVASQMEKSGAMRLPERGAEGFSNLVVAALPAELREAAGQLACLPWLTETLAEAALGQPGVLQMLVDTGLPITLDSDGTFRFPGALADALSRGAALQPEVARRVSAHHLELGRPFEALAVLRDAREWETLASLIVEMSPEGRRQLSGDELISIVDAMPDDTQRAQPMVLVELARALNRTGIPERQHDVLERATRAANGQPESFIRAVEVQRLGFSIYIDDRAEVAKRVEEALDEAGDGEERTVARALVLQGMLAAWKGHRDQARRSLRRAATMFVEAGEPYEAARSLMQLGFTVELHGDLRVAEQTFQEAVDLAGNDGRSRATALTYLGEIKVWLGRAEEGEADLEAALALARAVRDERAQAYAVWGLALHSSLRLDQEATVARVQETERLLSGWMDTGVGSTFMATMVDLLDRSGAHEKADVMLARVLPRRDEQPELITLAEFVVAARRGDPETASKLWPRVEADDGIELFERVRCRYLLAYAALRGGDPSVELLYRQAVAEAEAIGLPNLPKTLEPVAFAAFAEWEARNLGIWEVDSLGPLRVRRGGIEVPVPAGRPAALVGLLAMAGGPERVTRVIDLLWPDVSEADGRIRLRQVLYRLRTSLPDLIVRVGEDHIGFSDGVSTDLERFEALVDEAAKSRSNGIDAARRAVELYRGPLLEDLTLDLEGPDVEMRRAWARSRYLALLDLLSEHARAAGDTTEAVSWAERAHLEEPIDERRAVALARLLRESGRSGDAVGVLAVTSAGLRDFGLDPSPALELESRRLRTADA